MSQIVSLGSMPQDSTPTDGIHEVETVIPGDRIGPFLLNKEIGRGGMGVVYEATDLRDGSRLAVKKLSTIASLQPESNVRFEREARLYSRLHHPNIVRFLGTFEDEECKVILMELIRGQSLADRVAVSAVDCFSFLRIAIEACDALDYAHGIELLHRDIKPGNFLIDESGATKLMDFGLSKFLEDSHITRTGSLVGTPNYLAPEIVEGGRESIRSDIFSLGATLFHIATGEVPFHGKQTQQVLENVASIELPLLHTFNPEIPISVSHIVQRCLAKDPEQRFASTYEIGQQLRADFKIQEKLLEGESGSPFTAADWHPPEVTPFVQPMLEQANTATSRKGNSPWIWRMFVSFAIALILLGLFFRWMT